MKALSIFPEYAWLIHDGEKTVECRTWKTTHRGLILICASKTPAAGYISDHAVCVVDLIDIVPFTSNHLEAAQMDEMPDTPCYAWVLDNPRVIKPFPVRGKMGLFDVEDTLIEYMENERTDTLSEDEFDLYATKFYIAYEFPLMFMPGKHNAEYITCMGLSAAYRNNPELLFAPDPLPPELLIDAEEEG